MEKLVNRLSFTHLTQLFSIEDPLKRLLYEIESIKGTWSVQELKCQINSLYYERSGMSRNPAMLSEIVQGSSEPGNMLNTIKSPFTFEFLGLKSKDVVYESDLEHALIEHLEEFLMELGHGISRPPPTDRSGIFWSPPSRTSSISLPPKSIRCLWSCPEELDDARRGDYECICERYNLVWAAQENGDVLHAAKMAA